MRHKSHAVGKNNGKSGSTLFNAGVSYGNFSDIRSEYRPKSVFEEANVRNVDMFANLEEEERANKTFVALKKDSKASNPGNKANNSKILQALNDLNS